MFNLFLKTVFQQVIDKLNNAISRRNLNDYELVRTTIISYITVMKKCGKNRNDEQYHLQINYWREKSKLRIN